MSRGPSSPWSVPVALHDVPAAGRHMVLSADPATRAAVAKSLGLRDLSRLVAHFDLSRRGRDGLHVAGTVTATVGQTCVVTLEPIDREVEEPVDLTFAPASATTADDHGKVDVSYAADDTVEPLIGGQVDLGAIAIEFLTLAIDPYPRKAGVAFDPPATEDGSGHPFAALAALKKEREGNGG